LPDGVYEVQLGASYFPSEAGTGTNFVRRLKAGQKLTAKVNWLPDTYASPYNSLILYPWSFNVYDSGGRQVFTWTGTALEGSVSFTAASAGDYRMEILKRDDSPRCLRLNVNPSGWLKVPLPGEAVVNLPSYTASVLQQYNPAIANVVSPDPALVQAVLGLINQARFLTNPQAVDTGANSAAQVHAADMLKNGFLSHYGSDGLKPYMRYTLAGGTGYESECIARAPLDPPPGVSAEAYRAYLLTVLEQTWQSMLQNQVDQKTIFDSDYRHVNIGVACDADNLYLVLQFETDQVTFTDTPAIQDGILHLAGKISDPLYQVQIYYDPAPGPLSTGQLGYAYYPVPGRPVALIRRMYGLPYPEEGQKISWSTYADPYTVPLDAKPATEMAPFLQPPVEHAGTVKYIEADAWQVQGQAFSVTSDLSAVLGIYGPGVYTVVLWGLNPGQSAVAYSYSIFLK
jgi:uncharacterized protein YkwD